MVNKYKNKIDAHIIYKKICKYYFRYRLEFSYRWIDKEEIKIYTEKYKYIIQNNLSYKILWDQDLNEIIGYDKFFEAGLFIISHFNINFKDLEFDLQKQYLQDIFYLSLDKWITYIHNIYEHKEIATIFDNDMTLIIFNDNSCSKMEHKFQELYDKYKEYINIDTINFNEIIYGCSEYYDKNHYCYWKVIKNHFWNSKIHTKTFKQISNK